MSTEFNWLVGLYMVQCDHPKTAELLATLDHWLQENAPESAKLDVNVHVLKEIAEDLEWHLAPTRNDPIALFFTDEETAFMFKLIWGSHGN